MTGIRYCFGETAPTLGVVDVKLIRDDCTGCNHYLIKYGDGSNREITAETLPATCIACLDSAVKQCHR